MDDRLWLAELFEKNRSRLRAVAYRMLVRLSSTEPPASLASTNRDGPLLSWASRSRTERLLRSTSWRILRASANSTYHFSTIKGDRMFRGLARSSKT